MSNIKGFTLIELLIVLVISSVLLNIALPYYGDWVKAEKVKSISENVNAGIQLARGEAIKRNENIKFIFDNGGAWIIKLDSTEATLFQSSSNELDTGSNVNLSLTPVDSSVITFNQLGMLTTNDDNSPPITAINVNNNAASYKIKISNGGSSYVCNMNNTSKDLKTC